MHSNAPDKLFNRSVEKALTALTAFGHVRKMNVPELANAAGMSISSAQRCAHTLERLGYLQREPLTQRWMLTPRVLGIATAYLDSQAILERSAAQLVALNRASAQNVSLWEPDDTRMILSMRLPGPRRFAVHIAVGHAVPMFCTASGRAYLSKLPLGEAQKLLRRSSLARYTSRTLLHNAQILQQVESAGGAGYAWSDGEFSQGEISIAAPILTSAGTPIAALEISALGIDRSLNELREAFAPLLVETAKACSSSGSPRPL